MAHLEEASENIQEGRISQPGLASDMIRMEDIYFSYEDDLIREAAVLKDFSLTVPRGSYLAVLGPNGSGKSTFARLCNALILPQEGDIEIDGMRPDSLEKIYEIRQRCGMVFQNPDNQIVGTTVEEDTAFGPENLALPTEEIRARVDAALAQVGLSNEAKRSPNALSGGQKQKLGIAGGLAMKPHCLILDESTAMLDPQAAEQFLDFVEAICREEGLTLIHITHEMEEALRADQVAVISAGELLAVENPETLFANTQLLKENQLQAPLVLALFQALSERFPERFPQGSCKNEEEVFQALRKEMEAFDLSKQIFEQSRDSESEAVIEVKDLSYSYQLGTSSEKKALTDVNLDVRKGEIFAICGHSGCGKSTLITHFNGLFRPQAGSINVLGKDVSDTRVLSEIRRQTGLVFQYPEYQLFETTLRDDIAFGPRQLGLSEEEIEERVFEALDLVGLSAELVDFSPFELSGGQKRRAAIAGVLAMKPEILVLDEPAAGLDPAGRAEILEHVKGLREAGKTIVMVTHNMDDAASLADRVAVMAEGSVLACDRPEIIYQDDELLKKSGLKVPRLIQFSDRLNKELGSQFCFLSVDCALRQISKVLMGGSQNV